MKYSVGLFSLLILLTAKFASSSEEADSEIIDTLSTTSDDTIANVFVNDNVVGIGPIIVTSGDRKLGFTTESDNDEAVFDETTVTDDSTSGNHGYHSRINHLAPAHVESWNKEIKDNLFICAFILFLFGSTYAFHLYFSKRKCTEEEIFTCSTVELQYEEPHSYQSQAANQFQPQQYQYQPPIQYQSHQQLQSSLYPTLSPINYQY